MRRLKKKTVRILLSILLVLVVVRLSLPYFIKKYVNNTLNELDGYKGHVEDIDLQLWRGAYQIEGVHIDEVDNNERVPFLKIDQVDLSIEWEAIFEGALVGEIVFTNPLLSYTSEKITKETEEASVEEWFETVKRLIPIKINHLQIKNGKISYVDMTTEPALDIYIGALEADAFNLTNAYREDGELPSTIKGTGISIGEGELNFNMKLNLLKETPDFDLDLSLEEMQLPALNTFTKSAANFDIEEGNASIFTEVAMKDSRYEGYVKPIINEIRVLDIKKEKKENSIRNSIWEGFLGSLMHLVKNHPQDQFAVKAPFSGNINDDTNVGVGKSILSILQNAIIKALSKNIDNSINISDVKKDKSTR